MNEIFCYENRAYLVQNTEIFQDICECLCQVQAGMWARDLNDVEEHQNWNTILLKVDGNCNLGLMVGRRPCIGSKTEGTWVFLGAGETYMLSTVMQTDL